jgi:stage II sporulation protein D
MRVIRSLFLALSLVAIAPAAPAWAAGTLRVGLMHSAPSVQVAASTAADLQDARGRTVLRIQPLESWVATTDGASIQLAGPNAQSVLLAGTVRLRPAGGGIHGQPQAPPLVFADTRWYRGVLELKPTDQGVTVINQLAMDHYLYGVVPSEMSASWPMESLKAQAIAARSYAAANMGKHRSRGYDVCDTDECQVYAGAASEAARSNQAVDGTSGQVLVYGKKIIPAYFHSSSGGYTENSEDVWLQKLPYIRAVQDFDQKSPHFSWFKNVSAQTIAAGLARQGVDVGDIVNVNPVSRSYSGRVKEVQVVGTAGSRTVRGETFRIAAGLASTLFNVAPVGEGQPSEFTFAGRGWGHGLGLSQWGARGLAEAGYGYMQILGHYYPGAQLGRL